MHKVNFEPKYRRKLQETRQKLESNRHSDEIHASMRDLEQQMRRLGEERRHGNWWHKAEVFGLWAAALVGLLALEVSSRDSHDQRKVMQDQLGEMQAEFTANQRPWISVQSLSISSLSDSAHFDDLESVGDLHYSVEFELTNSGRTPAIFVSPNVTTILASDSGKPVLEPSRITAKKNVENQELKRGREC